jgi:hypothetical protein
MQNVLLEDNKWLKCPKCSEHYLHQCDTTIYQRSEDDKNTTVIAQHGHGVQVSQFPSDDTCNPSSRRHGMVIEFMCEHCHYDYGNEEITPEYVDLFRLAIYQHKGVTFIEWL